jgi:hypothetical protein
LSDRQLYIRNTTMEKTQLIEDFITIWTNKCNMLPIQPYEFDTYKKLIDKLRKNAELTFEEKRTFVDLIELMADTIYAIDNCANKYGIDYYQETKKYDEPELNCCSNLINSLQSDMCYDSENKYDMAREEAYVSDNNSCVWCCEMPAEDGRTLCVVQGKIC